MATIQEVYIALFGRPADPLGYQYYVEATNDGADLSAVGSLANSDEYMDRFEGQSELDMINQIYMDLFGRPADAEGLLFYAALLQSGEASIQDIAIRILDGATGTDEDIIENKVEAAQLFTDSLNTSEEILAYQGERAADQGREFLSGVTADDATIPTQAEVDAAIVAVVDESENPTTPGNIFTLTSAGNIQTGGVDEIEGTENSDTFRAITTDALDSTDILDGAGGNDVLNIANGGLAPSSAPVINSIETINNADSSTFNLESVTGTNRINTTSANAGNYTNAALATVFAATASTTVNVAYGDDLAGSSVANFATDIDDAAGTADFNIGGAPADAEGIEIVNLEVSGDADDETTVTLDADLVDLSTLNITGDGDVVIAGTFVGAADLATINASAATGNVELSLDATAGVDVDAGVSITTGSGADNVTLAGQDDANVTLGAGNDVLNLGGVEQGLTVTLGTGTDAVVFAATGPANIADADEADFEDDIISITDFNGSADLLNIGANATVVALNNVQQGSIGSGVGDTLFDAVEDAAAFTVAAGETVIFEFGGNTYVYVADANAGFDAGDGLVELVGFTGDLVQGTNFAA
jgi:hypothetical protein